MGLCPVNATWRWVRRLGIVAFLVCGSQPARNQNESRCNDGNLETSSDAQGQIRAGSFKVLWGQLHRTGSLKAVRVSLKTGDRSVGRDSTGRTGTSGRDGARGIVNPHETHQKRPLPSTLPTRKATCPETREWWRSIIMQGRRCDPAAWAVELVAPQRGAAVKPFFIGPFPRQRRHQRARIASECRLRSPFPPAAARMRDRRD